MKRRIISLVLIGFLIVSALSGCGFVRLAVQLDAVEDAVDSRIDYVEDQIEAALRQPKRDKVKATLSNQSQSSSAALTADQAKSIALEHAGYTANQVTGLYAERDMDDGISLYEVRFRVDYLEYNYDIHVDSGKVMSFDVDD